MNIKEAYKTIIRYQISLADYHLTAEQIEALVEEIHDSEDFHQHIGFTVDDSVEFWAEELKIPLYEEA